MNILNIFAKTETIAIQQAPGQLPVQVLKGTETPAPSIGVDNEKIIEGITKAKRVAVQLCRDGFKVLEISIASCTLESLPLPGQGVDMNYYVTEAGNLVAAMADIIDLCREDVKRAYEQLKRAG